jgi:hypothetical protein
MDSSLEDQQQFIEPSTFSRHLACHAYCGYKYDCVYTLPMSRGSRSLSEVCRLLNILYQLRIVFFLTAMENSREVVENTVDLSAI